MQIANQFYLTGSPLPVTLIATADSRPVKVKVKGTQPYYIGEEGLTTENGFYATVYDGSGYVEEVGLEPRQKLYILPGTPARFYVLTVEQ